MSLPELDVALFTLVNSRLTSGLFDRLMPLVTDNGRFLLLPFVIWVAVKERSRSLRIFAAAAVALAFADLGGNVLKEIVGRPRPCNALEGVRLLAGCGGSFSMPSNHAANAFAFAGALYFLRRDLVTALSLVMALIIGLSRVYVGVHYPGDVAVGALIGLCVSWGAAYLLRRAEVAATIRSYLQGLLIILFVVSLFRVLYIITGPLDLSPDEAHYWEWTRRLDWSYYSKGPMIAWLVYASTAVFGSTVFGVRAFAVLLSFVGSLLLFRLGKDLYDEEAGFIAAIAFQTVPLFSAFGVLFTIDSPFIFFWIASLLLFHRAAGSGPRQAGIIPWLLLGASVGIGLLTKYTMLLFWLCGALYLIFDAEARRHLRTPGPYAAAAVSGLVFSPVVLWNAAHGWVTVRHTAGQAHVADGLRLSAIDFFEFLGSQIGLVTPILFFMIVTALWLQRRERQGRLLLWFSLPVVLFFLLKSAQGKVQANWALTGYLAGLVAFGRMAAASRGWVRGLAASGIVVALAATAVSHYPGILHLPQRLDPTTRLAGWAELGRVADAAAAELAPAGPYFVISDSYQVSSELAFYMQGHPVTYCANIGRRMNQYDLWPGFEGRKGENALFVRYGDQELPEPFIAAFGRREKQALEYRTRQGKIMKFTLIKCYDFKGMAKVSPETY